MEVVFTLCSFSGFLFGVFFALPCKIEKTVIELLNIRVELVLDTVPAGPGVLKVGAEDLIFEVRGVEFVVTRTLIRFLAKGE